MFTRYVHILGALHRYDLGLQLIVKQLAGDHRDPLLHLLQADALLEWRADTKGAREALAALDTNPDLKEATIGTHLDCDDFDGDFVAARNELAACPLAEVNGVPRDMLEGFNARELGDSARATAALNRALTRLQESARLQPGNSTVHIQMAKVYAALGQTAAAEMEGTKALDAIAVDDDESLAVARCDLAAVYAVAGKVDDAFNLLLPLCTKPFGPHYGRLKKWPGWAPLRADARFKIVLDRSASALP